MALESLSEHRLNFDLAREAEKRGEEMFLEAHPEYRERLALPGTDRLVCWLLEQLTAYESRDETWRGKKEMLENDLAKAWKELERYKWVVEPVVAFHKRYVSDDHDMDAEHEAYRAIETAVRRLEGEGSPKVTESVTEEE